MSGWKEEDFKSFWAHYNLCMEWVSVNDSARQQVINDFEWKQAESDVYSMLSSVRPSTASLTAATKTAAESTSAAAENVENAGQEEEGEDEEEEEEMSEEMIAFMKQTLEHRQARDRQRQLENQQADNAHTAGTSWLKSEEQSDYVLADEVGIYGARRQTTEGPADAQRQAELRKQEMRARYGAAVEKLLAMEMSMNFKFTQHQNMHQPELWPNIPLRF